MINDQVLILSPRLAVHTHVTMDQTQLWERVRDRCRGEPHKAFDGGIGEEAIGELQVGRITSPVEFKVDHARGRPEPCEVGSLRGVIDVRADVRQGGAYQPSVRADPKNALFQVEAVGIVQAVQWVIR